MPMLIYSPAVRKPKRMEHATGAKETRYETGLIEPQWPGEGGCLGRDTRIGRDGREQKSRGSSTGLRVVAPVWICR